MSNSVTGYSKTKKKFLLPLSHGGGGKGLPLKTEFFCGFPYLKLQNLRMILSPIIHKFT